MSDFDPYAHLDEVDKSAPAFDPYSHLDSTDVGQTADTSTSATPTPSYIDQYAQGVKESGSALGAAFSKHPVKSVLGIPFGALETIAQATGTTVADAAAVVHSALDKIPGLDKVGDFNPAKTFAQRKAEYEKGVGAYTDPQTDIGKAISQSTGAVLKPAGDVMSLGGKAAGSIAGVFGASPETQQSVEGQTNALVNAGLLASAMHKSPKGTAIEEPAPVKAENPDVVALKEAQKLGYVVPPATSNPTITNRVAEGLAGKISTAQGASIKNQQITNSLVRSELGLPADVPLTHETLDAVRQSASPAYEAIKKVPDIQFGPKYEAELARLSQTADKITSALPNYKSTGSVEIKNLIDSLKPEGGVMDGETAVELSKSLRSEASAYELTASRTGDPSARALARAYRGASEAAENAIEDHLNKTGQPELAANWDNARRLIAKSYSVQNAIDGAGNVDAGKLGKQLLKGKPLSGNLEAAANFANAYPKAAKIVKESMPGMSPLDVYGGAAVSAASGNPAALLVGPARMAARSTLLGPVGQYMARPGIGPIRESVNQSIANAGTIAKPVALSSLLGHPKDKKERNRSK